MHLKDPNLIKDLNQELVQIISETNGVAISDTLELLKYSNRIKEKPVLHKLVLEFDKLLAGFHHDDVDVITFIGSSSIKSLF